MVRTLCVSIPGSFLLDTLLVMVVEAASKGATEGKGNEPMNVVMVMGD
jgi:hypothetical protein